MYQNGSFTNTTQGYKATTTASIDKIGVNDIGKVSPSLNIDKGKGKDERLTTTTSTTNSTSPIAHKTTIPISNINRSNNSHSNINNYIPNNSQLPSNQNQTENVQIQNDSDPLERAAMGRKRKWGVMGYQEDEQESMERTVTVLNLALLQDQASTLFPSPPKAFTSFEDVVDKLLPYHIWQIHDEELLGWEGEDKSRIQARISRENAEGEDVLRRMTKINERFNNIRHRDAEASYTPALINIIKDSTASIREQLNRVQAELRVVEREKDSIEAESRRQATEKERIERERMRITAIQTAQAQAQIQAEAQLRARAQAAAEAKLRADAAARALEDAKVKLEAKEAKAKAKAADAERRNQHRENVDEAARRKQKDADGNAQEKGKGKLKQSSAEGQASPAKQAEMGETASPRTGDSTSTPSTPPTPLFNTPSRDRARGRGRGRPRGSGRGGLRETVLTHTSASVTPGTTPGRAGNPSPGTTTSTPTRLANSQSVPSQNTTPASKLTAQSTPTRQKPQSSNDPAILLPTSSRSTRSVSASQASTMNGASPSNAASSSSTPAASTVSGTNKSGQQSGPVLITVNIKLLSQFVPLGIIAIPPIPHDPTKHPGTIVRTSEDKQNVTLSLNLALCTPPQLRTLAKLLNVKTGTEGSSGMSHTPSGESTPGTNASA